jgi:hypothetical protein
MVKEKYDRKAFKTQEKMDGKGISRIGVNTEYSFSGTNMSPFGGLFAASCFVKQMGLEKLLNDRITTERKTRATLAQYILSTIYLLYIGYERVAHIQYVKDDPLYQRVLGMNRVPGQSSVWRFLNKSLDKRSEGQLRETIFEMQERVWQAANIGIRRIHIDTDTTVETVYGEQENATVGYNPTHRGKKSYQPVLSTMAETGVVLCGRLRSGDTISGEEIKQHLEDAYDNLPAHIDDVTGRLDSGFYCKESVDVHERRGLHYIISVKKSAPIQQQITNAKWKKARKTDGVGEFWYQPKGWEKPHRYVVARHKIEEKEIQTDMFMDASYKYRVFVTDLKRKAYKVVAEYEGRAGIENLIEESKNQIAMAKVPGKNFASNASFLQIVILAFNLNKWLQLIGRQEDKAFHWEEIRTSRYKHLYIATKMVETGHRIIIRFAADYPYKEYFNRLIDRLRKVRFDPGVIQGVIDKNLIAGTS